MQAEELARAEALLAEPAAEGELAALRQALPGRAITLCDAADLTEGRPYRVVPRYEIYLVDGTAHCWQLTTDPAAATGLLLARRAGA